MVYGVECLCRTKLRIQGRTDQLRQQQHSADVRVNKPHHQRSHIMQRPQRYPNKLCCVFFYIHDLIANTVLSFNLCRWVDIQTSTIRGAQSAQVDRTDLGRTGRRPGSGYNAHRTFALHYHEPVAWPSPCRTSPHPSSRPACLPPHQRIRQVVLWQRHARLACLCKQSVNRRDFYKLGVDRPSLR
jgi:hypothetical protein